MNWPNIKAVGQTIVGGFGDKTALGVMVFYLKRVEIDKCLEYIEENKDITIEGKFRFMYREMAKAVPLADITDNDVYDALSENRPDLNSLILNHPKGLAWLHHQVENIKATFS